MIKARGGTVIATTSTEEKAALARGAGADETIGYEGFGDVVREFTGGAGAHVVYDAIGATTFEEGMDALRTRGMFVLYGMASGPAPDVRPAAAAGPKSLYLTRPGPPGLHRHARGAAGARAGDVLGWIADGSLDVRIGERYPLEDARRAHEDLEARRIDRKAAADPLTYQRGASTLCGVHDDVTPTLVWVSERLVRSRDMSEVAELVRAAAEGDQAAWNGLVDRYNGLVWSVARSHRLSHGRRLRRGPDDLAAPGRAPRSPAGPRARRRVARHDRAPRVPAHAAPLRPAGSHRGTAGDGDGRAARMPRC